MTHMRDALPAPAAELYDFLLDHHPNPKLNFLSTKSAAYKADEPFMRLLSLVTGVQGPEADEVVTILEENPEVVPQMWELASDPDPGSPWNQWLCSENKFGRIERLFARGFLALVVIVLIMAML